jgi:hypothetical protein
MLLSLMLLLLLLPLMMMMILLLLPRLSTGSVPYGRSRGVSG